jgi:hypothetical protein
MRSTELNEVNFFFESVLRSLQGSRVQDRADGSRSVTITPTSPGRRIARR